MLAKFSVSVRPEKFWSLAGRTAQQLGADLFLSYTSGSNGRLSYVGIEPSREMLITADTNSGDIADFAFADADPTFGFFSYNYGLQQRGLITAKTSRFPLGHLKKYATLLAYDPATEELRMSGSGELTPRNLQTLLDDDTALAGNGPIGHSRIPPFVPSLDRGGYIEGVRRVLDYIREGYTYQLCLSTKFTTLVEKPDAAELFMYLWRHRPAPFYSFFHSGPYRIISTSPERFLQVTNGRVLSQPIKGTLRFEYFYDSLVRKLVTSAKEDSELSMIVDLIRNDISYNCRYGSVEVENHKSTFIVDNLLQMYSNVRGILKPGRTCLDLLLDAFPGGSVTGCPKRMSMQLIDQLEPHTRDIYCGSLFVLKDRLNMDSSVAIRTGFLDTDSGELNIYGGSGIVIDSDPEAEYLETVAKAEKFLQLTPYAGT